MWNLQQANSDTQIVKSILIVEDDPVLGNLLREALQEETPYQVHLAPNGEMALGILQEVMPDLFLLDYHLPGMSGLEFAVQQRSREAEKQISIILMSADLPQGNMAKYHLRCLQKPFDLDTLLQLIAELLAA